MDDQDYVIKSTSRNSSEVQDIEIGRSPSELTRRVLRAEIVNNVNDNKKCVEFALVHQRRASAELPWEDLGGKTMSQLKAGEAAKFQLNTTETGQLLQHLINLYEIGKDGVKPGLQVLKLANEEEVIRTDAGRARIIRKLLAGDFGKEIWDYLSQEKPDLARQLTSGQIVKEREEVLVEFEQRLSQELDENDWKRYFKKHSWLLGSTNVHLIEESRLDIYHDTDIPFEVDGGFLDLVELKLPTTVFWTQQRGGSTYLYRGKFPVPSAYVMGAVMQTTGYILQAEKNVDSEDFRQAHGGIKALKPRGLVVIGRSNHWGDKEWQAFRLLNDELHGVQVITFDILLSRAKKSVELFKIS